MPIPLLSEEGGERLEVSESRNEQDTLVSLGDRFDGFIEEQIARGRNDPFAVR